MGSTYLIKDYYSGKGIQMKGYFKTYAPILESGRFEFYYENGQLEMTGNYCDGDLCGSWNVYNKNGEIENVLNYNFEINSCTSEDTVKTDNLKRKVSLNVVDSMPEFNYPIYNNSFIDYCKQNIEFPRHAAKYLKDGTVIINFQIDVDGKVCNAKIVEGSHKDFNKEALRIVNNSPIWQPGFFNGKPVRVEYFFPIKFLYK